MEAEMNGNDRNATHEARIGRLEVSVEFIMKRVDDFERRMEQGFRDMRTAMRWLVGFAAGTLLAVQLATLALVMRGQHLL
jgi:hypothetical protein